MAKWRETPTTPSRDLASALADLAAKQEPLGPGFEAALGDRSALYDYSDAQPTTPLPEAIVKAALERAAQQCDRNNDGGCGPTTGDDIRALASNRDEINAILLKAAGEGRG